MGIAGHAPATNQGKTLHVANNGMDSSSCGGKANPCRSVGLAITNATPGDTILVVRDAMVILTVTAILTIPAKSPRILTWGRGAWSA